MFEGLYKFEVLFEGLHKISKDNYQSTDPRNKHCYLINLVTF